MQTLTKMWPPQKDSPITTLVQAAAASATTISVGDASILPAAPFPLTLGVKEAVTETVLVTSKSGNTLALTRGLYGTPKAWPAATKVARVFTAGDLQDVQDNIRLLATGGGSAVPPDLETLLAPLAPTLDWILNGGEPPENLF